MAWMMFTLAIASLTGCRPATPEAPAERHPLEAVGAAEGDATNASPQEPALVFGWNIPRWASGRPARHGELVAWSLSVDGEPRGIARREGRATDELHWWASVDGAVRKVAIEEVAHGGHAVQRPLLLRSQDGDLVRMHMILPSEADVPGTLLIQEWLQEEATPREPRGVPLPRRPAANTALVATDTVASWLLCWGEAESDVHCGEVTRDGEWQRSARLRVGDRVVPLLLLTKSTDTSMIAWTQSAESSHWRLVLAGLHWREDHWTLGPPRDVGGDAWSPSDAPPTLQGQVQAARLSNRTVVTVPVAGGAFARSAQVPHDPTQPVTRRQSPPWAPPLENPALIHDQRRAVFVLDSFGPQGERSVVVYPSDPTRPPQMLVAQVPPAGPSTSRVVGHFSGSVLSIDPDEATGQSRLVLAPVERWLPTYEEGPAGLTDGVDEEP